VFRLQPVQPIDPEPRPFVAVRAGPKRNVLLLRQILAAAIVRSIVHHQEMIDAQLAVVTKEIFKPDFLISQGRKHQNIVGFDLVCPVVDDGQIPALAESANAPPLALQPQPI